VCLRDLFKTLKKPLNASDYFQIDPKLGTLADFHTLVEAIHNNQYADYPDGVFNHCGRGFFAFTDVLENATSLHTTDWFHIKAASPRMPTAV